MKISDIKNINKPSNIKRKTTNNPGGNFSSMIDEEEAKTASTDITGLPPISSISGILAAQIVEYDPEQAKRQMKRGNNLLNYLEKIRLDLLSGNIDPYNVKKLAQEAKEEKEIISDPNLAEIINEIEIRAEVEIAKLSS